MKKDFKHFLTEEFFDHLDSINLPEKIIDVFSEHAGQDSSISIKDLFKEVYEVDIDSLPTIYLEHFYNKLMNAIKYLNYKRITFIRKREKGYFNLKTIADADYNKALMNKQINNAKKNIEDGYIYVEEEKWKTLKKKKKVLEEIKA